MATTKRSKKGRTAAPRAKTAKAAATSKKRPAPRVATGKTTPKTKLVAKPKKVAARPKPRAATRAAAPKGKAVKAGGESPEVSALKSKFQRERNQLERNLTEAVREIGILRHHELRVTHLERQLAERDVTIARLQTQLADLERRPVEPVYVHEIQQTLALGTAPSGADTLVAELDEFEDEQLPEEAELASDED